MSKPQLPKLYYRLFRWFCDEYIFEELQGDLEEDFYYNAEHLGTQKAVSIYKREVLQMIRPSVIRSWKLNPKFNSIIMFKNYFKTSVRSLMKNPLSSFINIIGLSAAIGVCVFTFAFTQYTYRTDQFHENKDKVFLVTFFADRDGQQQQIGTTPAPLAKMLQEDFAEIEATCRVENRNVIIKSGQNTFHESIRYVDPSFLTMFTFPLKWGSLTSLRDPNSIVISEEMSIKYFGDENPIGLNMLVKFGKDLKKTFKVTGVVSEPDDENSLFFNFLIHHDNIKISEPEYNASDWSQLVHATLIQLDKPDNIHNIHQAMEKYRNLYNTSQSDWKISDFGFEPLSTIHYRSEHVRDDIFWSSHENYNSFIFLYITSAFLLALACFNYINIAIVTASKRLKEISLRKVIGATRSMITLQFLAENILLTSIAALMGVLLGWLVFIPWFEGLFLNHFQMNLSFTDYRLYIFLLSIVLFTGIASGLYPALYIAKLQVISIMKGSLKFGQKNLLTKILLGFQLVLACLVITTGIMFTLNHQYISERSWGYHYQNVIYTEVPDHAAYENLSTAMHQNPNVVGMAGSVNHLGKGDDKVVINRYDKEYEVVQLAIGPNYFETMGLELQSGRTFQSGLENEKNTIIVNELLVDNLGIDEPIGEILKIDSIRYQIIGVAKNFHNKNFYSLVKPTVLFNAKKDDFRYLTLKVKEGTPIETYADLQMSWVSIFPEEPFLGGHQEDVWGNYFIGIANHGKVWTGFAFIATLLTALGIYGLVTLNVSGRRQEFSIRKILGARPENIGKNIMRQYIILFGVAIVIGAPLSYYANDFVLNFAYNYHIPMTINGVIIAASILIFILIFVVVYQVIQLAKTNPVIGLRSE